MQTEKATNQSGQQPTAQGKAFREEELAKKLAKQIEELEMVEKLLHKMRLECEQRCQIWKMVKAEIDEIEEKACIYRYRMDKTQDLATDREHSDQQKKQ